MNIVEIDEKEIYGLSTRTTKDDNARIQAVIETWRKVWGYFGNEISECKRTHTTDFEYYKNQTDIDICISINKI